jgi:AcrR family transcriptional regulator
MFVNSHPGRHAIARKKPVQGRSQLTVQTILDAAAHMFGERGYSATTTNHVAEAAGVSIGSLYQYFPNKDSLIVALEERHLDHVGSVLLAAATRWQQEQATPTEWARDLVNTLITANDSALHLLIYDTAPPLPHLRKLTESITEPLQAAVAVQLRRWGHGPQSSLRAEVLVVTVLRLVHDLAIRTPRGRPRTQIRDEIVRTVETIANK